MIRLGVVGFGTRARSVVNDAFRAVDKNFRVVGVVDPDPDGVRQRLAPEDQDARFYPDLDALVRDGRPDALVIATQCDTHADLAARALTYGLPLFLEKPVAVTMEQALRLEDAWRAAPGRAVVSFPLRLTPLCRLAREEIDAGRLGEPLHVFAHAFIKYGSGYFERFYRYFNISHGLLLQKATHDLDYLSFLMGRPIVRVAATALRGRVFGGDKPEDLECDACPEAEDCPESPRNRRLADMGGTRDNHACVYSRACGRPESGMNEDVSQVMLEFEGGAIGVYAQNFFTRRHARRGAVVSGRRGTLSFDWNDGLLHVHEHYRAVDARVHPAVDGLHGGGDPELARDFFRLIRHGAAPRAGLAEGLRSVYACLAAQESTETGRFVDVRQPGRA